MVQIEVQEFLNIGLVDRFRLTSTNVIVLRLNEDEIAYINLGADSFDKVSLRIAKLINICHQLLHILD